MLFNGVIMEPKVFPEALPLTLKGQNSKAVLIVHGFTGYPGEYYELAHSLNKVGYTVAVPRLPGHGTNRRDFNSTGWRDWLSHVENTYLDLQSQYQSISVVGLSMGGILAILLGARFQPEKLVLLAPGMAAANRLFYWTPWLKWFVKELKADWSPRDGDTENIRRLGQEYWSVHNVPQLSQVLKLQKKAKRVLPDIDCPILLMVSEQDEMVPLSAVEVISRGVSRKQLQTEILSKSSHVLVTGVEKEYVQKRVINWLLQEEKP